MAERVLERIRADGPLSSLDFERERGSTTDWFGAPTNVVRAVLEAYAVTGVLGLARRDGNRRYYDLIERLVPADVLTRKSRCAKHSGTRCCRAIARTASWEPAGGDIFSGLGPAKPDPEQAELPGTDRTAPGAHRRGRARSGGGSTVCAASASSFATRSTSSQHRRSRRHPWRFSRRSTRSSGTAPFSRSLFDFDYVWELFFPPEKRRWGWYVLPILFRDRLVGRIEPRIDRDGGRVEVIGLWWEDGFNPARADGFVDAMREALRAYLRFAGVDRLGWAKHLGKEKRLFPSRP